VTTPKTPEASRHSTLLLATPSRALPLAVLLVTLAFALDRLATALSAAARLVLALG
jgi:hypothetical protein